MMRVIDIFNSLLLMSLSLALASKLPMGSFLVSASESDIKSNELNMFNMALITVTSQ